MSDQTADPDPPTDPRLRAVYESARRLAIARERLERAREFARRVEALAAEFAKRKAAAARRAKWAARVGVDGSGRE